MTRAGAIPLSEIADIRIYVGKHRNNKAGMKQILTKTEGDIVMNGSIFLRNFDPCCHLKVDGTVLRKPDYRTWAISWNTPEDFGVRAVPSESYANYMACVKCLVDDMKVKMDYQPDMAYPCNRGALGTKDGAFAYYATEDNLTPEQLQDRLYDLGWNYGIMLDGGGSACIQFEDGTGFAGDGRTIPFWIVVKVKKRDNEPEGEKPMVEINAYSLKLNGKDKLAKNFTVKEFACKDGSDAVFVARILPIVLQYIRVRTGKAVTINSGYRTVTYNEKVGGVANSQHLYGCAADITVKGVAPTTVASIAREIMPDWGGVGIYSNFTHIDVREEKADWKG